MDDSQDEDQPPCPYCWALGWAAEPCPGHRLAERLMVCAQMR